MKINLIDIYAIDTGALIELCTHSIMGDRLRDILKNGEIIAYTHEIALTELSYILCRKIGWENAKRAVDSLLLSGYINIYDVSNLIEETSKIKCERPIALSDCLTLALAKEMKAKALFATRENEILREMNRKPFETEIEFLIDQ